MGAGLGRAIGCAIAVWTVSGCVAGAASLTMPGMRGPSLAQPVGQCRLIAFESLRVDWDDRRGVYLLTVAGTKPFANMDVALNHRSYGSRPAYWMTSVVGCTKNFIVFPVPSPYTATMPLTDFVGTRGVEIVGLNGSVRRPVPRH